MKDLEQCRKEIDEIDEQIIKLFEQRMAVSKDVIDYKLANNLEIFQPDREAKVIEKNVSRIKNPEYKQYAASFVQDIMDVSKSYQAKFIDTTNMYSVSKPKRDNITVGYQGVPGAFGHQAMLEYFGEVPNKNYQYFEDVFKALINDEIDYGIVPLENSSTGAINDNYDFVREYDLYVVGELSISIGQHLLGLPGTKVSELKDVYSHPQGIYQCSNFLNEHKHIQTHDYTNTAASAKLVSELQDKTKGAIASKEAAKIYGLEVIQENIHDLSNNHTRFIVIGKQLEDDEDYDCCSLMFTLLDKPGALSGILKAIKEHNINLTRIESRPMPGKNWEYFFYIDFEASIHDDNVRTTLQQIKANCTQLRVLGNYKQAKE